MNRIFVGTGVTKNYLPKATNYLKSLAAKPRLTAFCVTLDFVASEEMKKIFPHVHFVSMKQADVKTPVSNYCLQHGDFLDTVSTALNIEENDIVIFTDADLVFQRDISEKEWERFSRYTSSTIGVGWNSDPTDTLRKEFERLDPRVSLQQIETMCGDLEERVYNTGVMIARPAVWRLLRDNFALEWPSLKNTIGHYAAQQWVLSWLFAKKQLNVDFLDYDIHIHGHHALPKWVTIRNGQTFYKGQITLIRHHLDDIRKEFFFFGEYIYDSPVSRSARTIRWRQRLKWPLHILRSLKKVLRAVGLVRSAENSS